MCWREHHDEVLTKQVNKAANNNNPPITSLLLLAEVKDYLGEINIAKQLYEYVIEKEPKNALGHAALGLLRLFLRVQGI